FTTVCGIFLEMCAANHYLLLLVTLFIVIHSASTLDYASTVDYECEWHAGPFSPFCGSPDCPTGWEKSRSSPNAINSVFDFGIKCLTGEKTLCCRPMED
ncbi:hypothetical protein PENTCL1PPCAC_9067, partial [Pristionchus entomophagus]